MNDLENYKAIIDFYFGNGTSTFDASKNATNPVIGALNKSQFHNFQAAFRERLRRLSTRYKEQIASRAHLLSTVNEVGSERNWNGAYAELVAYDFLNSEQNLLSTPISLSNTVNAKQTLSGNMGNTNVNFDGYYEDFDICFDVKVLSDKSKSILDRILSDAKTKLGIPGVAINPEYPLDIDFTVFENNRSSLLMELLSAIDIKKQTTYISSTVLPDLKYRLMWKDGILFTSSSYNPYQHAESHHTLLFKHVKKFSKISPSLIVFVFFPWFSEKISDIQGTREIFYRSFCRRFFCQYLKDQREAKEILSGFQCHEKIYEVTDKLSGVLFLEDQSITTSTPLKQNVKALAYLNPNATNKVSDFFRDYLSNLDFFVDDFEYDNY